MVSFSVVFKEDDRVHPRLIIQIYGGGRDEVMYWRDLFLSLPWAYQELMDVHSSHFFDAGRPCKVMFTCVNYPPDEQRYFVDNLSSTLSEFDIPVQIEVSDM